MSHTTAQILIASTALILFVITGRLEEIYHDQDQRKAARSLIHEPEPEPESEYEYEYDYEYWTR